MWMMEKNMETTTYSILGYIGIMEKKVKTTTVYWGYIMLHRDNGKEHGNYYVNWGYIGITEKNMETAIVSGLA